MTKGVRTLLFSILILTACSPKYQTSTFLNESEMGYECVVYSPKEPRGTFVYLSDSAYLLNAPTPLMLKMLKRDYTVIVPKRWGGNGRAIQTTDSYKNRVRGVSYSVSELLTDHSQSTIVFAEGYYTPVALRIAKSFQTDELWLVEPMSTSLMNTIVHMSISNEDTLGFRKLWNIESEEEYVPLKALMDDEESGNEKFIGPYYSRFLRSYWYLDGMQEQYQQLDSTRVKAVYHSQYPLHNSYNVNNWDKLKMPKLTVPASIDTVPYSLQRIERVFIKDL